MNNTIDLLPLSSYLSTTSRVKELLVSLDHLKTSYFQKNQSFASTLEHEIPYPLSEILTKLAQMHQVNLAEIAEAETFFTRLQEAIENMPHLILTISVSPTFEMIKEINHWATENLKQAIVLDFVVDEQVIGGAKIAYKGKIVDHTVKKRMEAMIQINNQNNKNQITNSKTN